MGTELGEEQSKRRACETQLRACRKEGNDQKQEMSRQQQAVRAQVAEKERIERDLVAERNSSRQVRESLTRERTERQAEERRLQDDLARCTRQLSATHPLRMSGRLHWRDVEVPLQSAMGSCGLRTGIRMSCRGR